MTMDDDRCWKCNHYAYVHQTTWSWRATGCQDCDCEGFVHEDEDAYYGQLAELQEISEQR
jgi:hypothetical protein